MIDKKGYEIKQGHDVKFQRPSSDGKLTQEVLGEVIDVFEKTILVQDEENDTYNVFPENVEVIMNRRCNVCFEEFNIADVRVVMADDIVGNGLHEEDSCPHCGETDIENI